MLFAIICHDRQGGLETRRENRPAHLEHLASIGDGLKGAGPFLDDDNNPTGSMVIVEMANMQAARAFAENDPYAKAGLFASVDIRVWNWILANPYA